MKRCRVVISKAAVKTGKTMARWAESGMNWAEGPHRTEVMAAGREVLRGGAVSCDRIGRIFLAAEKAAMASGEGGHRESGWPAACWWQAQASQIFLEGGV